jgi:hypothetical protein
MVHVYGHAGLQEGFCTVLSKWRSSQWSRQLGSFADLPNTPQESPCIKEKGFTARKIDLIYS